MNSRGVFITGTDTNVGKTYIGVHLIQSLVASEIQVTARKPVESGCEIVDNHLVPRDATALFDATGQNGKLEQTCPYRFSQPISPERAAMLEGVDLTLQMLANVCLRGVKPKDFLLVEGAGGFYSPLTHDGLNVDLARRVSLPVLLVAANRLGCINHVLLTTEAIQKNGLELMAVVLNETQPTLESNMNNSEDLKRRLSCPVISVGHNSADGIKEIRKLFI